MRTKAKPRFLSLALSLFMLMLSLTLVNPLTVLAQEEPIRNEPCAAPSWSGQLFSNNNMSGAPEFNLCRRLIDFIWGDGSPYYGIHVDNFSFRWTTQQVMPVAGTYEFMLRVEGGARLLVNNTPIIEAMQPTGGMQTLRRSYNVATAGEILNMTLESTHPTGNASLRLDWSLTSGGSPGHVQDHAITAGMGGFDFTAGGGNVWEIEHFPNAALSGAPVALGIHVADGISYDYDERAPRAGLEGSEWSSRWRRTVDFIANTYTFTVRATDAARVLVDGNVVVDWTAGGSGSVTLTAGRHVIVVEHRNAGGQGDIFVTWDPPVGTMLRPDGCNALYTAGVNGSAELCPGSALPTFSGGQSGSGSTGPVGEVITAPSVGIIPSNPSAPVGANNVTTFSAGGSANTDLAGVANTSSSEAIFMPSQPTTANSSVVAPSSVRMPVTVSAGPLYFRPSPSSNSTPIRTISRGEQYVAVGRSADNVWVQLEVGELLGWSQVQYLNLSGQLSGLPVTDGTSSITPIEVTSGDTSAAVVAEPATSTGIMATARGNMRVRVGPGSNFDQVGDIGWGSSVEVIGKSRDGHWLQVVFGDLKGWSSSGWFEFTQGNLADVPLID